MAKYYPDESKRAKETTGCKNCSLAYANEHEFHCEAHEMVPLIVFDDGFCFQYQEKLLNQTTDGLEIIMKENNTMFKKVILFVVIISGVIFAASKFAEQVIKHPILIFIPMIFIATGVFLLWAVEITKGFKNLSEREKAIEIRRKKLNGS